MEPAPVALFEMPEGTRLYHGTSAEDDFSDDIDGPFWVSDGVGVAKKFIGIRGPRPRVMVFEAESDIQLVDWSSLDAIQTFVERYTGGEFDEYSAHELSEIVCEAGYDGWAIPNNYPEGADIMLCDPMSSLVYVETTTL
ncbi:MAG: hypothetical protein DRH30_09260 [Deltaproteobacteria bacterium]|nr:MAG: hypothetical protein DRH30_09260 [Deltaproteobacteria bacterium]